LKNNQSDSIHIVAYQVNNKKLAERRAKSIKKYLLQNFKKINPLRLKVSWFGVSENIRAGKKVYNESESINFITAI
jgi:outer membrane protein OmpA-like peptidoglycan-associated protein